MKHTPLLRVIGLACLASLGWHSNEHAAAATPAQQPAGGYINTWLVCGTFDNDTQHTGLNRDWIGETNVAPKRGLVSTGKAWRYFDDRLFSRNIDNYQDLFSAFRVRRGESIAAKVVYAHAYVFVPRQTVCRLRLGADNAYKAWINGRQIGASTKGHPVRDAVRLDVTLVAGWNRLLLKIANTENGRLGFYARLCDSDGKPLAGLITSPEGGQGPLRVATSAMDDIGERALPDAYREWPYVGADAVRYVPPQCPAAPYLRKRPDLAMQGDPFVLQAGGGKPPYTWSLLSGKLPAGLSIQSDGRIVGTVDRRARLGDYRVRVQVVDAAGATAGKDMCLRVNERPSRWYERARLTALIHHPESMPADAFDDFARLMQRQGYGIGMVISYNNGRHRYRWQSIYEPDCPTGNLVGKYKAALERAGVAFGMYVGNLNGPNHGGDNGAILLIEDAIRRYQPKAFWFDWAGWHGPSMDAIYSMIRSYDPDTLIVLNGVPTICNGDWDVIVLEGWGAWGERHWDIWPFHVAWPKKPVVETWRLVADPEFVASLGVWSDWRDYVRLQISLIGEGFVADIDHSPTIAMGERGGKGLTSLDASHVMQCHRQMTTWANPIGRPSLVRSYTGVDPAPLPAHDWGYATVDRDRTSLYLHAIENPRGKTGLPSGGKLSVSGIEPVVWRVTWMNQDKRLAYTQTKDKLEIDLKGVHADGIDTIFRVDLAEPAPNVDPNDLPKDLPAVPPGNLACHKPAALLSTDGQRHLIPSSFHFARYGVDGTKKTTAQGAHEWAWTFHVDLEKVHQIERIVIHFGRGYATEYEVHLSADGRNWQTVAHVRDGQGGRREHTFKPQPARHVRVEAVKPNGPNQAGDQMSIAEVEVYE